jgi:hypothetical protein
MSEQKLTPWFPASVKPVREGVYEVKEVGGPNTFLLRWFRKRWWLTECDGKAFIQDREWRGLSTPPKESP